MYKQLLVAVDFSDEAWKVIEKAKAIGLESGAVVDILHVAETSASCYGPIVGQAAGTDEVLQEEILASMKKHLLDDQIKEENLHALLGQPATTIIDFAAKIDADLLVLGTHGRHGWKKILGSTAAAVVHSAPADVLLVKIDE
jgi:universal stress protein A